MPKPTKGDIITLKNDLVSSYKKRNSRFEDAESMYDIQAWQTPKLKLEDRLASPVGHNTINILTSMTVAAKAIIDVPPYEDDQDSRKKCSRVENFARSLMAWQHRDMLRSLKWDAAFYAYLRGCYIAFVGYDPDAQRKLRMEIRDPKTIYPVINRNFLSKVICTSNVQVSTINAELGNPSVLRGKKETDTVEFTEYWDDTYKAFFVDDRIIGSITEHKMGFLPWGLYYGWGTPLSDCDKQSYSVLFAMYDLWKSLNRVTTYIATASKNAAIGSHIVNGPLTIPDGMSLDNVLERMYDPGNITYNEDPTRPLTSSPVISNTLPKETQQMLQVTQRWIDETGVPSVVYGVEPGGVTAAIGIQALLSGPKAKVSPFIDAVERGLAWITEKAIITCKEHKLLSDDTFLKQFSYVVDNPESEGFKRSRRKIDIKESDIDEDLLVEVRIGDIMPKDNVQVATVANILSQAKLLARRDVRKDILSREDPDKDADNILEEQIMDLPSMKATIAMMLAAKRGLPLEPFMADMGMQIPQPNQSRGVNPGEIGPGGRPVPAGYTPPGQPGGIPVSNVAQGPAPMGPQLPPSTAGRPTTGIEAANYLQRMPGRVR